MAHTKIVAEGTTSYLTAIFKDKDGVLAVPTSISYEIEDKETGTPILAATAVAPLADTVEVTISAAQNAMVGTGDLEDHLITFTAGYGGGEQVTNEYVLTIKNLQAL